MMHATTPVSPVTLSMCRVVEAYPESFVLVLARVRVPDPRVNWNVTVFDFIGAPLLTTRAVNVRSTVAPAGTR
jgi:hypothetical protein